MFDMQGSGPGWQLRAALLPMDSMKPGGFTSEDLARYAGIDAEAAHEHLKSRRRSLVKVVGTAPPSGPGRPRNLYSLTDRGREELIGELARLQRLLTSRSEIFSAADPSSDEDPVFGSIVRLETVLNTLYESASSDFDKSYANEGQSVPELIQLARSGEGECVSVLASLRGFNDLLSGDYEKRLSTAVQRLNDFLALDPVHVQPMETRRDLVRDVIDTWGGRWFSEPAKLLEPVFMLFEGANYAMPERSFSQRIANHFKSKSVKIVGFDLSGMDQVEQFGLFHALKQLRDATPVAAYDLCLVLDGRASGAERLVHEFKRLSPRYPIQLLSKGSEWNVDTAVLQRTREHFIAMCANAILRSHDERQRQFALTCNAALVISALRNDRPTHRPTELGSDSDAGLQTGGVSVWGRLHYHNTSSDEATRSWVEGSDVEYSDHYQNLLHQVQQNVILQSNVLDVKG